MEFAKSTLAVCFCIVASVYVLPSAGQAGSELLGENAPRVRALSGQEFHCNTGYSLDECQKDIRQLKNMLLHYPIERLGHWTWVLVRSQDWKPISQTLRLDTSSPAFSALDLRQTFLEEAIFSHDAERTAELMQEWQRSMPALLELAVSHELGHAFCGEPNEAVAKHFGEELRGGLSPACRLSKADKNSVVAGEARRAAAYALRAR